MLYFFYEITLRNNEPGKAWIYEAGDKNAVENGFAKFFRDVLKM